MKCIDAVEGTVKCILKQLHSTHNQACSDDSEYIHQVKTVISAIDQYVEKNPELINDAPILKKVLYVYSRDLWLSAQTEGNTPAKRTDCQVLDNDDYQTYYYDYLYDRGVYPS
jgi:hypothetical protein